MRVKSIIFISGFAVLAIVFGAARLFGDPGPAPQARVPNRPSQTSSTTLNTQTNAASATPSVGAPSANPSAILANTTTTAPSVLPMPDATPSVLQVGSSTSVTITIPIPSSSLIPNSVNLLQMNSTAAPVILGQLHDDGQNGDLIAGDSIYSIRTPFSMNTPGSLQLRVSAAFRGALKRVTSSVVTVSAYISTPPLPADPGAAGNVTLAGIDFDHDGVRDDVQRYIALTYPSSRKIQTAITQVAKAELSMILNSNDPGLAKAYATELSAAVECLSGSGIADVNATLTALERQIENTPARMTAYLQAQPTGPFFYTLSSDSTSRCLVPPNALPN